MENLKILLNEAKEFAIKKIIDYPDKVIYHDIKFAKRYQKHIDTVSACDSLNEETVLLGRISAWLISASYDNFKVKIGKDHQTTSNQSQKTCETLEEFTKSTEIPEPYLTKIKTAFKELFEPNKPSSNLSKLLFDAMALDLVLGNNKKHLKQLYEELLLNDVSLSKKKWNETSIGILNNLKFYLPLCQVEMQPKIDTLIQDLEKDKKTISKQKDIALRKEFNISEQELKELKKKLKNSQGRDDRGIQTMFRTTSRNHYTMNEMVDKKANIMITVNAIILSLVLGGLIGQVNDHGHLHFDSNNVPILLLTITSTLSIIFAILSIRPNATQGSFTEQEIRNKEGNLLFYGNYHDMSIKDYEWGFMQMMNDQQYLYSTMIKDLYYLGKVLHRKYKQIRISLTIFLFGLTSSVASFFILRFVLGI